jgi:TonB family protein
MNRSALSTLILALFASTVFAQLVGDFTVYIGSPEPGTKPEVIVSMPENQLTPTMGLKMAEEIKQAFNLKTMTMIWEPRMQPQIGKTAKTCRIVGEFDKAASPVSPLTLDLQVLEVRDKVVHARVSFTAGSHEKTGAEIYARLGEPVSLANRLDGQVLFLLCTFRDASQPMIEPKIVQKVNPVYPEQCRKERIQGVVVLRIVIAKDGTAKDVQVEKSDNPDLSTAAINAVKYWKWEPALKDGKPTEVFSTVTVRFALH